MSQQLILREMNRISGRKSKRAACKEKGRLKCLAWLQSQLDMVQWELQASWSSHFCQILHPEVIFLVLSNMASHMSELTGYNVDAPRAMAWEKRLILLEKGKGWLRESSSYWWFFVDGVDAEGCVSYFLSVCYHRCCVCATVDEDRSVLKCFNWKIN